MSEALWYTLNLLTRASRYNDWIFSHFRSYVGRRVLEVGCGIGTFTPYFVNVDQLVTIDIVREGVAWVQAQWGHLSHVIAFQGDITDSRTVTRLAEHAPFDTIVFFNVLEHIPQDDLALVNASQLLTEGGHVLIYVPAEPGIFGALDTALGHHRRYSRADLLHLLQNAGLTPLFCTPTNVLGMVGWWLDARVWGVSRLPIWQIRLFDALVPILRPVEHVIRSVWPMMPGLSLACVARKRPSPQLSGANP